MIPATTLNAQIDLLLQIDRLLAEADRTRALRDRLIEAARSVPPPPPPAPAEREAAHV